MTPWRRDSDEVIAERRRWDTFYDGMVATCRVCGRKSIRVVGITGFCSKHTAEAQALGRYSFGAWTDPMRKLDAQLGRWEHGRKKMDEIDLSRRSRKAAFDGNWGKKS